MAHYFFSDKFQGLGIFVDTFANARHAYTFPRISAMLNDGTQVYDHDNDGEQHEIAACSVSLLIYCLLNNFNPDYYLNRVICGIQTWLLNSRSHISRIQRHWRSKCITKLVRHVYSSTTRLAYTGYSHHRGRMDRLLRCHWRSIAYKPIPRVLRVDRWSFWRTRVSTIFPLNLTCHRRTTLHQHHRSERILCYTVPIRQTKR